MSQWIAKQPVLSCVGKTTASRLLQRVACAAGAIGITIAVALDARESNSHIRAYQRGDISRRQRANVVTSTGGGIAGAWAGGIAGGWIGGSIGGPFVWATVPVGAAFRGILGYFGGSTVTGAVAEACYAKVDEQVKREAMPGSSARGTRALSLKHPGSG